MTALEIIQKYIAFFEKRGHKRIENSPLVPENDPTTLFTSSGMQPLVSYLLGETHPMGKRLVNVQNSFRTQDIDEVGDNRHTTFFRMLGNWSLGDYFKKEEIPWLWELLTKEFELPKEKLFITIFKGGDGVSYDKESYDIWSKLLEKEGFNPKEKIFAADVTKNWWSRSGMPENMPTGEPGGPDTEVYYKFTELKHKSECQDNPIDCECGKFIEIANSVFIQYQKQQEGNFKELPQKNVDYGGGVERLMSAVENQNDIFQTSLLTPIAKAIENIAKKDYRSNGRAIRIIADHLIASVFMAANNVVPSNKEQGYILRRLIRRALDNFYKLGGKNISPILEKIVEQYGKTDNYLIEKFKSINNTIIEEEEAYSKVLSSKNINTINNWLPVDIDASKVVLSANLNKYIGTLDIDTFMKSNNFGSLPSVASGTVAFEAQSTLGVPTDQTIILAHQKIGNEFDQQEAIRAFNILRDKHQNLSRVGGAKKFAGGLADHSEKTIMGHTATHLLHKALRDMFGEKLHQTGSNITSQRTRFDFNFDRNLTPDELKKIEETVNQKIKENLSVHFEMLPLEKAKEIGAIGLFNEKYSDKVKVYSIGDYSKEICGGPHAAFTSEIKSFKIIKQENIGKGVRRIYAKVG